MTMDGTTDRQGLSLQQKEAFIFGTVIPAMTSYTYVFTCNILGLRDNATGILYGSGLRCILSNRRAILTACHVIREASQEPQGLAISTEYGKPPYVVHGAINFDPIADLAVYFLPDDYPADEAGFWPSARMDRELDRLATDYLFLHGFPGKGYLSPILGGLVIKSLPYGAMQRLDDLPAGMQPHQFAIEYRGEDTKNQTGFLQDVPIPHGLSGSPVWRIGVSGRSSQQWSPSDSLLVGTITHWNPEKQVLIATSTEKLPLDW